MGKRTVNTTAMATRLSDIERELADVGFTLHRIRSSHRHYRNTRTGQRISLSYHKGRYPDLSPGQVAAIRKDLRTATQMGATTQPQQAREERR